MSVAASPEEKIEDTRQNALRAKIALVCHLVRWLTGGYLLFVAWGLYDHWSDGDRVQRVFNPHFPSKALISLS